MIKEKESRIGEHDYRCSQLGAREATRVFARLCNVLGPMVEGFKASDTESSILSGIGRVLQSAKADDLEYLCDTFAKTSRVRVGEDKWPLVSDVYESHFAGRFTEQMQWLGFCLQVNYADFLGGKGLSILDRFSLDKSK